MENAETPDEGKKTDDTSVTKPAASPRKPAAARGSQAKSPTAKPSAPAARKPAAKKPAAAKPSPTAAKKPAAAKPSPTATKRATAATSRATTGTSQTSAKKGSKAPRTAATKQQAPKPASSRSTKPKPEAPIVEPMVASSATTEARSDNDAIVIEEVGVDVVVVEPELAQGETAPEAADEGEASVLGAENTDTPVTDSALEDDDKPAVAEKPDAVLAGLTRLRALAAQFAAPAAEAVAQKAAARALEDEKAAAAKAETDTLNAEQAEAEQVATEQVETELADAEDAETVRADADASLSEAEPVAAEEKDEAQAARSAVVAVDATVGHGLEATSTDVVLQVNGLSKDFGDTVAVADIRLSVRAGVFYGIVGPNGAGKTTTLSMITGLLRPDSGNATVNGVDVWESPEKAKRSIGVLPDRLRIFDRLTGSQLLYYSGVLRGLDSTEVRKRSSDLASAFGLDDVMGRLVSDYSSGMLKKVALAAAMIHSPRLLVLDEPFESVDPVSAATVTRILKQYVNAGGTVLLSSHRMELVQRVCSHVAVIVEGKLLADGTVDEVRNGMSLEDRFVQLTGKNSSGGGLEWLSSFSD